MSNKYNESILIPTYQIYKNINLWEEPTTFCIHAVIQTIIWSKKLSKKL